MTTGEQEMGQSIRYTVTVDDVVAYSEFHCLHSARARRSRHRLRVILSILLGLVYFVLGFRMHQSIPWVFGLWFPPLLGLLVGLTGYGIGSLGGRFPFLLRYLVRKRYAKADMSKYLGEHCLQVDDQGFTHRTSYSETRYAWGAIDRIETANDRTFLYISSLQAVVVPHKSIQEGNFATLLTAIKAHYKPGQMLETGAKV